MACLQSKDASALLAGQTRYVHMPLTAVLVLLASRRATFPTAFLVFVHATALLVLSLVKLHTLAHPVRRGALHAFSRPRRSPLPAPPALHLASHPPPHQFSFRIGILLGALSGMILVGCQMVGFALDAVARSGGGGDAVFNGIVVVVALLTAADATFAGHLLRRLSRIVIYEEVGDCAAPLLLATHRHRLTTPGGRGRPT